MNQLTKTFLLTIAIIIAFGVIVGLIIKGFLTKVRRFPMWYPGNFGIPLFGTPVWGGISHPFGFKVNNSPYMVKVLDFKLSKPYKNVWDLKLKLVEVK